MTIDHPPALDRKYRGMKGRVNENWKGGGGGNINAQYDVRHVTLARTMRQLQRETGDEPADTFISTLW